MNEHDKPTPRPPGERRSGDERRVGEERREEFRFELNKSTRRLRADRRSYDPWDGKLNR